MQLSAPLAQLRTPLAQNAPVIAAFADLYYTQARGCETRGVFAYDERLALFPSYMWHGTVPFTGAKPRLTFAFDLVPGPTLISDDDE